MSKTAAALALIAALSASLPVHAQSADAAVRAPLEQYLLGQATGLRAHYEQAFHKDAELFGMQAGRLVRMTSQEFVTRAASGEAAPDEAQRKRWIERVDVTGDTAVAKLVLDYPSIRYTDYMSLVKTDGRWVIVNKTYMAEPKARTEQDRRSD